MSTPTPDIPEARLAAYWRNRARLEQSDFDRMQAVRADLGSDRSLAIGDARREIGVEIMRGLPLYFAEFYLAVGAHYLLTELSYEAFYQTRWHETNNHRAYGAKSECALCRRDRQERAAAKRAGRKQACPTG